MKQERTNPREIEGKQALFIVNLEPRKMRGVCPKGCYSISAMPTMCGPFSLFRRRGCPTVRARYVLGNGLECITLCLLVFIARDKANRPALGFRRFDQLLDGLQNGFNLGSLRLLPSVEIYHFPRQVFMRR